MASCSTRQWVSTAPYFSLTVTQSSSASTTVTLSYTVQYVASYAASTSGSGNRTVSVTIDGQSVGPFTYAINGVTGTKTVASGTVTVNKGTSARTATFSISVPMNLTWSGTYGGTMSGSGSISIPAKTSYTVSYNANGGTGAPGSQTKWAGTNLTLSTVKPTRTGYSFNNWLSSAQNITFSPGASYTYDAGTTMKAQWTANTYTVTFNANGGTGAPSAQTKTYGVNLTLSSTKPTRTNYNFKGWGVSASSTTVAYSAGGTYSNNASITLYAIWELAYTIPRITGMTVDRCTSSGALSDEGTYAIVSFSWATDKTVSSIKIDYKASSASSFGTAVSVSASGTSGTVSKVVGGSFDTETIYNIRVTVTDSSGSNANTVDLAQMSFIIDFKAGGTGVAFGKPADTDDLFEVDFPAQFNKNATFEGLQADTATFTSTLIANEADIATFSGKTLLDSTYPVGSIYIAYNHTSPASLFGGSWSRISGAFLWGCDSAGTIGQTGGERTVTLSINEMPSHNHYIMNYNAAGSSGSGWTSHSATAQTNTGYTNNIRTNAVGNGAAHNNMPPFIQVAFWRRTA